MQDEKLEIEKKKNMMSTKRKTEMSFFELPIYSRFLSTSTHRVITGLKNVFKLSWLRVRMSYHRFNNLAELLNGDLAAKIGRGICSKDLIA